MSKPSKPNALKVNVYEVLSRAVEEGVASGWRRAHKHTDKPDAESVMLSIDDAVMGAICEVFVFEDHDL